MRDSMFYEVGSSSERSGPGEDTSYHILDFIPESVGLRAKTARGGFMHSVGPWDEQNFCADAHFTVVTLGPAPSLEAIHASDKASDAPYGMITINPAGPSNRVQWTAARENIVVAITTKSLEELAFSEFERGSVELRPPLFGTVDLQAVRLAEMMMAELGREGPHNELYADSLVVVFGIHLLRNYSGAAATASRPKGGLTTTAASRVQEYIEDHFTRKLSVIELADVCELSPGHFIQSFTKTFGEPPHRYIVNRRLEFAAKLLIERDLTIAEVAYLSGFSSQSHLTSAMRKYKHTTPAQVRTRR